MISLLSHIIIYFCKVLINFVVASFLLSKVLFVYSSLKLCIVMLPFPLPFTSHIRASGPSLIQVILPLHAYLPQKEKKEKKCSSSLSYNIPVGVLLCRDCLRAKVAVIGGAVGMKTIFQQTGCSDITRKTTTVHAVIL